MKRIFASIIISILWVNVSLAQEGKKIFDIVNEIKAEMNGRQQQKKTSIDRPENDAVIGSGTAQEKKGVSHNEKPTNKKESGLSVTHEYIIRLLEGNARFVSGHTAVKDFTSQRAELTKGQHPYAIVLCCSDSRVPPELLFDESLGQLFVVRVAGNVVDSVALGSIEYASEHLHTSLIIVLGHEGCGAVAATIKGGEVPPNIAALVKRVKPAVEKVKNRTAVLLQDSQLLNACVEENVREQLKQSLLQSGVLREMSEEGEIALVGAVYSLESGTVHFLSTKSPETSATPERNEGTGKAH